MESVGAEGADAGAKNARDDPTINDISRRLSVARLYALNIDILFPNPTQAPGGGAPTDDDSGMTIFNDIVFERQQRKVQPIGELDMEMQE